MALKSIGTSYQFPFSLSGTSSILIELDGPAAFDTVVTVLSSDPTVFSTFDVTVPAGQSSATALITHNLLGSGVLSVVLGAQTLTAGVVLFDNTTAADPPTDINMTGGSIAENSAAGAVVATLAAVDPSLTDTFAYSINGSSPFVIVGDQVRVAAGVKLDFETRSSYTLDIVARDSGGAGGGVIKSLTFNVSNVSPELLSGTAAANVLTGGSDLDRIFGLAGNDTIFGLGSNDVVTGGLGRDTMSGGTGLDDFDFNAIKETGKTSTTRDRILDFVHLQDDIDLSTIDASTLRGGNQAFKFIGTQSFHEVARELHYFKINAPGTANDKTVVEGDVNGDGKADFQIELKGLKTLSSVDFIL